MDRARDYHFVEQMPRRTAAEVDRQDATYDRQVLLNETWAHYCQRLGRSAAIAAEERSKWETETWAEYEHRVVDRTAYLNDYAARQEAEAAAYAQREAATSAKAAAKVKQLHAADESRVATDRLGPQHSLLLDFDDLRAARERRERLEKEEEEAASRAHIARQEADEFASIKRTFADQLNALYEALEARRLAAEAEAQRQREERMKREQAAREAEERRRREAEEAEKRRREAEEEAKRAERRRKDEERRLKAKAERDAARGGGAGAKDALNATTAGLDATISSPQEDLSQHKAARDAREKRVLSELEPYQHKFVAACAAIAKDVPASGADTAASKLDGLLRSFVDEVGAGRLLFHTAVYVGLSDEAVTLVESAAAAERDAAAHATAAHGKLHYRYASENCNAELRSGHVSLELSRHAHAPSVAHCVRAAEATPVIELGTDSAGHLVRLDAAAPPSAHGTPLGEGYFFASPITAGVAPQHVYGCISIDTASIATARDPEVTLQPQEQRCYTSTGALANIVTSNKSFDDTINGSDTNQSFALNASSTTTAKGSSAVAIFPQTQQFITECSRALGDTLAVIAAARKAAAVPVLKLDSGATASLPALYAGICHAIQSFFKPRLVDVYVSRFARAGAPDATIVCHNGVCVGDVAAGTDPLLGQTISKPSADAKKGAAAAPKLPPTFALQLQGATTTNGNKTAASSSGILTPDVSDAASGCVSYRGVPPPHGEALFLLPLYDDHDAVAAVIGISCAAADGGAAAFTDAVKASLEGFCAGPVRDAFAVLLQHQIQAALCEQAVDWMCLTTGASNAYLALLEGDGRLRIVAASESQAFLKGKTWGAADGGVTLPFVKKASSANTAANTVDDLMLHVKKINDPASTVKLLRDGLNRGDVAADAEMIAAVVTARHNVAVNGALANAPVYGVLVADSVNAGASGKSSKSNAFTDADKEMLRTTAFLLAEALSGSHLHEGHALAIDAVIDPDRLAFLKRVYHKVSTDVKNITANQLSEMARYNSPPAVIPTVCSATLIATGVKPASVAAWDDIRKRLTQALLEKMGSYDPTSLKVKKAFFTRAKKLTAGLTAGEVFSRGSYPASCFFAWTFATVLLRRAADSLRRRAKAGLLDAATAAADGHADDDDATSASATDGGTADADGDGETDEE